MKTVVHVCDICAKPTNYERKPVSGPGFVGYHDYDWRLMDTTSGEPALICASCEKVLHAARALGITLPEPSETIIMGGPFLST